MIANRALGGGDLVRVAAGVYEEAVKVGTGDSGAAGNPVVFRADGTVFLQGTDRAGLDDTTGSQCTAALDCTGNGAAYPMVWRFNIGSRPVTTIVETAWTPIRVDDSAVTGVVFDLTKPIPSKAATSVAETQQISGSWFRSGNYLYVHTYQDVAPSSANNLEIITADTVVEVTGDNVTFDGFVIRYASSYGFHATGSGITLRNAVVHSVSGMGIAYNDGATKGTVENVDVSHIYARKAFTVPDQSGGMCYTRTCGWHNNAGGTGLKVDGGPGGGVNFLLRRITAYNSWNVMSVEQIAYSTLSDIIAKNSPNHTLIFTADFTTPRCNNLVLERTLAFNGQDSYFVAGCQNSKANRNAFGFYLAPLRPGDDPPALGWKLRGGLSHGGVYVGADATPGFSSDRSWYNATGQRCRIGDSSYGCNSAEWHALGHDTHSNFAAVKLAGFASWPPANGLALSVKNREDFYPIAGSSTIDAGDPDIDGDGVVENGPGGDDECTAAHYCAGVAPDIGPFEFGLVTGPPVGNEPPPPNNVQRSDTR